MADANATNPSVQVAVGYPVHQIEHPWPLMGTTQGSSGSVVRVQYMKTFIVLVFVLACVQTSMHLLCVMYLQEIRNELKEFTFGSKRQ